MKRVLLEVLFRLLMVLLVVVWAPFWALAAPFAFFTRDLADHLDNLRDYYSWSSLSQAARALVSREYVFA